MPPENNPLPTPTAGAPVPNPNPPVPPPAPQPIVQTPAQPAPEVEIPIEPQTPSASPLKQIRTFQGDIANALNAQKESLFSIQQQETLKRASGGTVPSTSIDDSGPRKEFFFLIVGSLALISLGLTGAWYGYQEFLRRSAAPLIATPETRFLPSQESLTLNAVGLSRETLLIKTAEESLGVPETEIKHFILRNGASSTAPLTTTAELFQVLKTSAPGNLVRAFEPLYMLGSLGQSRFLLIKLSSFENAFAGMLSWEQSLPQDLVPLMGTAPYLQNIESNSVFKDIVWKNKDVRVIYASTTPALMYSFFDNQMLIITDSFNTLETLLDRLTRELLVN